MEEAKASDKRNPLNRNKLRSEMMDDTTGIDICRVCHSEGLPESPLFHPCICTGSIKYIHQECLVQWMRYSRNEYCELCRHHFSFAPVYSPDMPSRVPLRDVARGLLYSIVTALKCWLHFSIVAFCWLGLLPLLSSKIYRGLFSGSVDWVVRLPLDIIKRQFLPADIFHGYFVITCTLSAIFGMVWLREQIAHGGGPDWLEPEQEAQPDPQQAENDEPENENLPLQGLADAIERPVDSENNSNNNNSSNFDNNIPQHETNGFRGNSEIIHDLNEIPSSFSMIQSTSNNNINNSNTNSNNNSSNNIFNNVNIDNNNCNDNESIVSGERLTEGAHSLDGSAGVGYREENESAEDNLVVNSSFNDSSGSDESDFREVEGFDGESEDSPEEHENAENNLEEPNNEAVPEQDLVENAEAGLPDQEAGENAEVGVAGQEPGENAQDDRNWNRIEWNRAVEELTWERLLGLDGSMAFVEHVIYVMVLYTLFVFVFAFLPYQCGNFAIGGLGLLEKTIGTHFEGLITTLCGYCIIGICLLILHTFASPLGLQRSKRILGLCYMTVKVSLLSVVEIGVLPLICGWWLDICSLSIFDATLKDREISFRQAPGTSMFIHWLIGMAYVCYFTSFIHLLREVVRPGVLWFLINLNDPDFSPIQEMIHTPIIHHIRRLLAHSIVFGTAVLLMLFVPVRIIRYMWPTFLPYAVGLQIEVEMNELPIDFFLLQIIFPSLQQSHIRIWMKDVLRLWCRCFSWVFGIHSYLLGDETEQNVNEEQIDNNENNQGILNGNGAHQALIRRESPIGVQPYCKPPWFYARLMGLLLAVCVTLVIANLAALTIPVWIGRKFMSLRIIAAPNPVASGTVSGVAEEAPSRAHELYTACYGVYLCWLILRALILLRSWVPKGRALLRDTETLKLWFVTALKCLVAFTFLAGIIPLLFGLLLEIVFVVPARVPLTRTPILFIWQDWVLGVLYTKIACAIVIIIGPDWNMRRAIERVYRDGIRNMDLQFILRDLVIPVTTGFSLALAVPYAVAHSIIPRLFEDIVMQGMISRLLYPIMLLAFFLFSIITSQIRQFKKLYEKIKNDKYLVGKRLVNYDPRQSKALNSIS